MTSYSYQIPAAVYAQPKVEMESRRGFVIPLLFLLPVVFAMISNMSGGLTFLTDVAMISMSLLCVVVVIVEFAKFPKRFGIGALVMFGGVLVWFTWDYMSNWLGRPDRVFAEKAIDEQVLARAVLCHTLFVAGIAFGFLIPLPRFSEKLFTWVPEPVGTRFYFCLVLVMFGIGLLPMILNTHQPFYVAIFNFATGGEILWKSGRSGNVNFNFGAYWAQVLQIGKMGAIFGMAYAIFLSRSSFEKVICWLILFYHLGNSIFSHARGDTVFLLMPIALFLFFRHQSVAAYYFQKFSMKAYVTAGITVFVVLVIAQFQINYRGRNSLERVNVKTMTNIRGNTMFSESLVGFALIPDNVNYFYANYPGEALLRTMPQVGLDFMIGPIPRAIWKGKPVDPVWVWYNEAFTGRKARGKSFKGTTISPGAVGYWHIRGGYVSIIQGSLFIGMVIGLIERVVRKNQGRLMVLLFCFGVLVFFFRAFRGIHFHNLYPTIIGMVVLWFLIKCQKLFR